jgi:hypothetical protein
MFFFSPSVLLILLSSSSVTVSDVFVWVLKHLTYIMQIETLTSSPCQPFIFVTSKCMQSSK